MQEHKRTRFRTQKNAHKTRQHAPTERTVIRMPPLFATERILMTNKKNTANCSHMNKRVLKPDIPRVSSTVHPLAVFIIVPFQVVFPPTDITIARKAFRSPSRILDMPVALPKPAETFPAGVAVPFTFSVDDLEGWAGLVTAQSVRRQRRLLTFWCGCLGRWWRRGKGEVARETAMRIPIQTSPTVSEVW